MTIGDEKVVFQFRAGTLEGRVWRQCSEEIFERLTKEGTETRALIPQSAYAELAAKNERIESQRAYLWREKRDLLGSIDVNCATIATLRMELETAESQLAELRGAMEKIGRRAADHPDDDDADRKRNLYHISAIVKGTLAAADGATTGETK